MGIWDKVKSGGQKVKLQGEITFLRREITGRQKTFGVELYNLLTNDKNKLLGMSAGTLFKGQSEKQGELKDLFEGAREDIAAIEAKKDVKQKDLDVLEVKGAHTLPDSTMGQKANKAGRAFSNGAKATKLQTEMAWLDREIKVRKEQFGVDVYPVVQPTDEKDKSKNPVKRLSDAMANMSQQEQDIQLCIDKAKEDVNKLEGKIRSKETEIHSLDGGESEPMVGSV